MNRVDALGKAIARRRRVLGMTQRQLAESAGIHRNAVGLAERGQTCVSVDILFALAESLQTTASELLRTAEGEASTRSRPTLRLEGDEAAPAKQTRVRQRASKAQER